MYTHTSLASSSPSPSSCSSSSSLGSLKATIVAEHSLTLADEKAIVEVKGGATGVKDVGRLAQVMEREGAKIGVLITNQLPTRAMERDAAAVGVWENEYTGRKHPRLQIITLAELFQNKRPDIPWVDTSVAKKARREETSKQAKLL